MYAATVGTLLDRVAPCHGCLLCSSVRTGWIMLLIAMITLRAYFCYTGIDRADCALIIVLFTTQPCGFRQDFPDVLQ